MESFSATKAQLVVVENLVFALAQVLSKQQHEELFTHFQKMCMHVMKDLPNASADDHEFRDDFKSQWTRIAKQLP